MIIMSAVNNQYTQQFHLNNKSTLAYHNNVNLIRTSSGKLRSNYFDPIKRNDRSPIIRRDVTASHSPGKLFLDHKKSRLSFPWLTFVDQKTGKHVEHVWLFIPSIRPLFLQSNSCGTVYVPSDHLFEMKYHEVWIYHSKYGFLLRRLPLSKPSIPFLCPLNISESSHRSYSTPISKELYQQNHIQSLQDVVSSDRIFYNLWPQKIQGWVIDSSTGQRLTCAKISIKRNIKQIIYTDRNGYFYIYHSDLLSSSFFLTIQKEQYITKHYEWSTHHDLNSFLLPLTSSKYKTSMITSY